MLINRFCSFSRIILGSEKYLLFSDLNAQADHKLFRLRAIASFFILDYAHEGYRLLVIFYFELAKLAFGVILFVSDFVNLLPGCLKP